MSLPLSFSSGANGLKGHKSKPCLDSHPQPNALGKTAINLISESKATALKEITVTCFTWKAPLAQAYLQRSPPNAQHRLCGTSPSTCRPCPSRPWASGPLATPPAPTSSPPPLLPKLVLALKALMHFDEVFFFHQKPQAGHRCHSHTHTGQPPLEGLSVVWRAGSISEFPQQELMTSLKLAMR